MKRINYFKPAFWALFLFSLLLWTGCPEPETKFEASNGELCQTASTGEQKCLSYAEGPVGIAYADGEFTLVDFGKQKLPKGKPGESPRLWAGKSQDLSFEAKENGVVELRNAKGSILKSFSLEDGEVLIMTRPPNGPVTVYNPLAFQFGSPLFVRDDSLGYQKEDCPAQTGYSMARLKSESSGGKIHGCMWQHDDGIGTMVVVDNFDLDLPLSPLLLQLNRTYWNWLPNGNVAKAAPGTGPCFGGCDFEKPRFQAQPEWDFVCRLNLPGLTIGKRLNNWLVFRNLGFDQLSIDPVSAEIGLEIQSDPDTGEKFLGVYTLGENPQTNFHNGFECN